MEKRKTVSTTTQTRNITDLSSKTNNIYETVMIITKRANQIAAEQKQELSRKLEEFISMGGDTIEEVFENHEQIEISKYYEKQPKPTLMAIDEFLSDRIYYRLVEKKEKDKEKEV
jgi:DNA-directed RNA polymerase subunit K/omega